ncbi:MAG TPA: bifunctional phosphopantothenoylcysteine decarboxylase/phosphopantothenate--cysteine ligase CoaBC [Desulfobacteraceae bacterium]|nr:bifunctional phosphopantothenoylcysteine decarboxylase/phosphopantothenate--cysteine ligase CoaBC [Desulfobacteraceae bacterium]
MENKNIVLCVCGGIAAYKSVELLRLLVKQNARVKVLMTQSAKKFIAPLTFEAISGHSVYSDLFETDPNASIKHIDWADKADAVVVAPATASIIGKMANGIADDAMSTFMLAVQSPILLCPSMNTFMYESIPVQRNLDTLENDGIIIMEPGAGELACGISGPGRLPEPEHIADRLRSLLTPNDLKGQTVLVTAGPTQEYIDPVRFISNPSSGKMGFAIAKAAEQRGAEVILITGPVHLPDPFGILTLKVKTAKEMGDAVFEHINHSNIIIKTAAVSDYTPVDKSEQKIKKIKNEMVLSLKKNLDILKEIGSQKKNQILIGFAAETEQLQKHATEKLIKKNLDMIVGNIVGTASSGFQSSTNKVTFFYQDGTKEPFDLMEKEAVAHILFDRIIEKYLRAPLNQ